MQSITIYFNERCTENIPIGFQWDDCIKNLSCVIENFLEMRNDAKIALPHGQWLADCGGLHFYERLKNVHPNREKYRKIVSKFRTLTETDLQLMQETLWDNQPAHGLNLADSINSWAVILSIAGSAWINHRIEANRHSLDADGNITPPILIDIRNLSSKDHALHWAEKILDWGLTPLPSCVLDKINGHPIVMYQGPLEHNPPHVHLLDQGSRKSLAKYRIDIFERPQGPPDWDSEMEIWISRYRDQLLRSWIRCQRGGFPYKIEVGI